MKEIDKIRIRQWNQDNPYIQIFHLNVRIILVQIKAPKLQACSIRA